MPCFPFPALATSLSMSLSLSLSLSISPHSLPPLSPWAPSLPVSLFDSCFDFCSDASRLGMSRPGLFDKIVDCEAARSAGRGGGARKQHLHQGLFPNPRGEASLGSNPKRKWSRLKLLRQRRISDSLFRRFQFQTAKRPQSICVFVFRAFTSERRKPFRQASASRPSPPTLCGASPAEQAGQRLLRRQLHRIRQLLQLLIHGAEPPAAPPPQRLSCAFSSSTASSSAG